MKNNFNISNEEKSRILNLHENRTKGLYLNEEQYYRKTDGNGSTYAVDANGKPVKLPSNIDIADLVDYSSKTAGYVQNAKGKISSPKGEVNAQNVVKPDVTNTVQKKQPDPKVIQIQEKLKTMGFASLLGKSGVKGDGVDGFLGQNTINAILQALSKTENVKPEQAAQIQMNLPVNQQEPELKQG
jgi:hypothetical protein